jgi:hypothetical protein
VRLNLSGGLDSSFSEAPVNGRIQAISVNNAGDSIYAGGSFSTMSSHVVNGIALLNQHGAVSTTFSPPSGAVGIGRNGKGPFCSAVYAIDIESDDLLIGGSFSSYRGESALNFAELDLDGGFIQ